MSILSLLKFHPVVLLFVCVMLVAFHLVLDSDLPLWSKTLTLALIFSLQILAATFEIQRNEEVQKVV